MPGIETISAILQIFTMLGFVVGVAFFIIKEWRKKDQDYDNETIKSLQNAVDALERERDILKAENIHLKAQLEQMKKTQEKTEKDVEMLKDLATGASAIDGLKETLARFEFIIPMMKVFQDADAQKLKDLQEIRQMIRDDRKATEAAAQAIGKLKTNVEHLVELYEALEKAKNER